MAKPDVKKTKKYLADNLMRYPVVINKTEYGYDAHCPILPGCHSQGNTLEEAIENIKDAIKTYLRMIAEETKGAAVYEVEVSA